MVYPERASVKLIGSRTGDHADLARTARCLRIHRRHDDFHLFDEIRTRVGERPCTVFKPSCRDIDPVPRGIHLADPAAREVTNESTAGLDAGRRGH